MSTYKKPVVTVDAGMAEGVYAASGSAQGTMNVSYLMVMDRWTGGGKAAWNADWSGINGTITLTLNFNDTVDGVDASDASVQTSYSGRTATLTFASTVPSPLMIGIHVDHATSVNDLQMTGYTYSVN